MRVRGVRPVTLKIDGMQVSETTSPLLTAKDLTVRLGDTTVLERLSVDVKAGEFLVLVGPSGCGKSTFLNAISGLLDTSAVIEGQSEVAAGARLGYGFQSDALLPWYTAAQNIAIGAELRGAPKNERKRLTDELLCTMHLQKFANCYPHQLSGGMRQRVGLARVLAYDADLILLDEPFGALDAFTRMALQDELSRIWHRTGKTVVLVTHDLSEALVLGTRIIILAPHPGRVHLEVDNSDWAAPRSAERLRASEAFLHRSQKLWESLLSVGALTTTEEEVQR